MGKPPQADEGNLYGRVLQRLTSALKEAERDKEDPTDLEVRGLTAAEFELIRAYLQQDSQWLSGWHAAAEEQAQLARNANRPALRSALRQVPGKRSRQLPFAMQQTLSCALCGASVHWPKGPGPATCGACGSQLLRARQRTQGFLAH